MVIALVGVAVMAVAGVDGPRPHAGEYAGLSAQRLPVRLTVAADRRTLAMDVSWCFEFCAYVERTVSRSVAIADDGSFSWQHRHGYVNSGYEESNHLRLEGHREGDGALAGTWRVDRTGVDEDEGGSFHTSTGDVSFRVGRGGSVRQPPPQRDASGNLVIPVDGSPRQVAVGQGRAWVFSETGTNRQRSVFLSDIDLRTGAIGRHTEIKDRAGVSPSVFTASGMVAREGAIWLTGGTRPDVLRVDARTRRVVQIPEKPGVIPWHGVAVGAGALWQIDTRAPGFNHLLLRSDPRTGRTVRRIRLSPRTPGPKCRRDLNAPGVPVGVVVVGEPPPLIAAGVRSVWVLSPTDSVCGRLSRIDARTNRVTRAIAPRHVYDALAVAPGGLWGVTRRGSRYERGRHALHRIGLRDGRPAAVTPLPEGDVRGLAVSRDAVWVSQTNHDRRGGVLLRIDRATGRRSTALTFQGEPSGVAIGGGAVWALDIPARTLIRIPL